MNFEAIALNFSRNGKREPCWISYVINPACSASLDTLKVSVSPAVKLAAAICAWLALDPDIIAAEIVEDLEAALQQFAAIANDLKK